MTETSFSFTANDGTSVTAYRWDGDEPPRGIVQIAHGMGEHAGRYRRLAGDLNRAGFVVYANDHRGHGATAAATGGQGNLGTGGWAGLVADLVQLSGIARDEHPGLPLVMIGHSMGSFALQQIILDHSGDLSAAVLSGTSAVDVIGAGIDPDAEVDLSAFNEPFQPARTDYDWLSRDPDEVDAYVADENCGFGLNPAGARSMLEGLAGCSDQTLLAGIRPGLPVRLVSGTADPLAGGGELIELVAQRYREAGLVEVSVALYPGARHEVFNETNRDEITAEMITWIEGVI